MFRRILIANRGEVATRVLKTCRRLGIETVAVYSDADRDLQWLAEADDAIHIGGVRSYLDPQAILEAATAAKVSAIHPGWGFLSENAQFASMCEASRFSFIGPRPSSIRRMGDKAVARETMSQLGLAPIPGSRSVLPTPEAALEEAQRLGLPVLLKALAGGGGRGMRKVMDKAGVEQAFREASAEALGAFGDGRMYMERLIQSGRHIELQLVGDGRGQVAVLGARECSIQRRHQKLIEETAVGLSPALLEHTAAAVVRAVGALAYRGAGTIEMLMDEAGALWFMEMNTRLQVEHTITEEVTGIDLVEWQLRVAANEGIAGIKQVKGPGGHAIECRINAESPEDNFRPMPGTVTRLVLPEGEGIRVDTHLREGDRVSPHYDSMIAKLICWGPTREVAIQRTLSALASFRVEGVPTTTKLHTAIVSHPDFRAGQYDTRWLERRIDDLVGRRES